MVCKAKAIKDKGVLHHYEKKTETDERMGNSTQSNNSILNHLTAIRLVGYLHLRNIRTNSLHCITIVNKSSSTLGTQCNKMLQKFKQKDKSSFSREVLLFLLEGKSYSTFLFKIPQRYSTGFKPGIILVLVILLLYKLMCDFGRTV